jgi:hypothetical protein
LHVALDIRLVFCKEGGKRVQVLIQQVLLIGCSSATSSVQLTAFLCDLVRHFKIDITEKVALCFGYPTMQHRVFEEPIYNVSFE